MIKHFTYLTYLIFFQLIIIYLVFMRLNYFIILFILCLVFHLANFYIIAINPHSSGNK